MIEFGIGMILGGITIALYAAKEMHVLNSEITDLKEKLNVKNWLHERQV